MKKLPYLILLFSLLVTFTACASKSGHKDRTIKSQPRLAKKKPSIAKKRPSRKADRPVARKTISPPVQNESRPLEKDEEMEAQIRKLEMALSITPQNPQILMDLAGLYYTLGDYLQNKDKTFSNAHIQNQFKATQMYDQAIDYAKQAVKSQPTNAPAYYLLGALYDKKEEGQVAMIYLGIAKTLFEKAGDSKRVRLTETTLNQIYKKYKPDSESSKKNNSSRE